MKRTVSRDVFIRAWTRGKSLGDVARKVHSTKGAAKVRAYRLRKRGVTLKRFRDRINVAQLNRIARAS